MFLFLFLFIELRSSQEAGPSGIQNQSTKATESQSEMSILRLFEKLQNASSSCDNEFEVVVPEEPEELEENEAAPAARAAPRFDWILERKFPDKQSCDEFIASEKCWRFVKDLPQTKGIKSLYACNGTKTRGPQCNALIHTRHHLSPEDHSYTLYRKANAPHNHEELENISKRIPDSVKAIIKELVEEQHTLKRIVQKLRDREDIAVQPGKNQVENYIKQCRKELYGDSKITLQEMVDFCAQNQTPPEDIDEAFVLAYAHSPLGADDGDINDDPEDDDDEQPTGVWIQMFVTTKRLLMNSANSELICADSTHKMVVQRWPILVFGTTDLDTQQHFHMLGMMISKTETKSDFAFGFKAIKDGMLNLLNKEFAPKFLMADAAAGIHNAAKLIFGADIIILMCFAHVIRAVDRRPFNKKENKALVKTDLRKLKEAYSPTVFQEGARLFLAKWRFDELEFVIYFDDYWIQRNGNWFNGAGVRVPSTNNALEATNGNIKIHQTFFNKKGLAEFKVRLKEIVGNRSKEYVMDKKPFETEVQMSKSALKAGYDYSCTKSIVHREQANGNVLAFMSRGENRDKLKDEDVDAFLNTTYDMFDEFIAHMFDLYVIEFDANRDNWKQSTCSCPANAAYFMCKHVLCIAFKLELLSSAPYKVLDANKKKGRPSKAGPPLAKD